MRHLIALSALLMGLAACGSEEAFQRVLDSYIDVSEDRLIDRWGTPDSTYSSGDSKYLTYQQSRSGYVPGTAPTYHTTCVGGLCTSRPVGGSPGHSYTWHCTVTFRVQGGQVTSWRYNGNRCVA